jgi:YVTN family beta-propeller protein
MKTGRSAYALVLGAVVVALSSAPSGASSSLLRHDHTHRLAGDAHVALQAPEASSAVAADVVATIPVLPSPYGIDVNPNTNRIYVSAIDSDKLQTINGATNAVVATATVGPNPLTVAVNHTTGRVFVTNIGGDTASVVDGAGSSVVATVSGVGSNPVGVAVDSTRNRAFVVHGVSRLSVIDGTTNLVSNVIDTGSANAYVAVNATTNRAYVTKGDPGSVAVIDLATGTRTADIPIRGSLQGLAVNETTNRTFVAATSQNALAVIDNATNTVVKLVAVGETPQAVAVNPVTNCIYVANSDSNTVSIVNGTTNRVVQTIFVGSTPQSIAANPATGYVYVANRRSNTVSVIRSTSCEDPTPPPDRVINKNVYVLVYDPLLSNGQHLSEYFQWNDQTMLTQGTVDFFRQVSRNRLNYQIVQTTIVTDRWPVKLDGFRYTEQEYLAVINGQRPPHQPDAVDYADIINTPAFDICGKVNRGEIDELWIYTGPYFGFYESRLVGPNGYWYNSPPLTSGTTCNRLLPVMAPSPHVGLSFAIHNFGHRTEATMTQVYGSWSQNPQHNWDRFARSKVKSNGTYSGCGDVHNPPNSASDYDYTNTAFVNSTCEDFRNYPTLGDPAAVWQPINCNAWGCNGLGYYAYWFEHFPSYAGCAPDGYANDWWLYFANPALALTPTAPCQSPATPTSTATPTATSTASRTPTSTQSRTPTSTATPSGSASAFYLGVVLGGPPLMIDGNTWQGAGIGHTAIGTPMCNQWLTFAPAVDAGRAAMLSCWVQHWAHNVAVANVPAGSYDVYVYAVQDWNDPNAQQFNIAVEGQSGGSWTPGAAGSWVKLGPIRRTVSDGTLNITTGGMANLAGVEIWTAGSTSSPTASSTPTRTHTPSATASRTPSPTASRTPSATPASGATFFRAVNLNGADVTIAGTAWSGQSSAANFSANGTAMSNPWLTFNPSTDAARGEMLKTWRQHWAFSGAFSNVQNGTYQVYVYVVSDWNNPSPSTVTFQLEGQNVGSYTQGAAGTWTRLGPYTATISDGTINLTAQGVVNVAGLEVWRVN